MRLQVLVVSLLASTTHGFLFNPLLMALHRYRMGNFGSSMGRSPFIFNRGGVLETIRRNQLANLRSILNRRRNLMRNRMGMGRGNGRFPQTPNRASINPERLGPFGGRLGGMQQPIMTVGNNANVMSRIGSGAALNQLANINNRRSNSIVGQIIAGSPNSVPQQQVAMSNILNTQQQQLAQNGVQATRVMAVPQQQLSANVGPPVVEIAQQLPNVAQMLQATTGIVPQQQLGTTWTANAQVPNVQMEQAQILQAMNRIVPQQQLGATVTNVGPSVVDIAQQVPNAAIGQAQTLQAMNAVVPQQQLGAMVTNVGPSVVDIAQQVPNAAIGQAQTLQAMNAVVPQQQLGAMVTNVGPSVVDIAQQVPNVAMGQGQTLRATNIMTPQQQFVADAAQSGIEVAQQLQSTVGSPVIEVTQLGVDQAQSLPGSNALASSSVADQLQQQAMLDQFGSTPQITVSDPQLVNIDNAIASTQQQITAIQNGIAEAKIQEQIIEANNKAAQQQQAQAQLRAGELGSMAIQQQLINAGNNVDLQQPTMGSAEQLQQQQFLEMNNAIQNQGTNILSPFPQQPNLAESFVQQLLKLNNAGLQQQAMPNIAPTQQDINNFAGQQPQLFDMNNMVQNPVPEFVSQSLQQQIVDMNNAIGEHSQPRSSSNVVMEPSQQIPADFAMQQQQLGSNIVSDPISVNVNQLQGLNVMSEAVQQPQNIAEQFGQMTEPLQMQQTLVDMTNTLNPDQQMGSAITGSNIDPLQQQPMDINIPAEPQPQTIGSVMDPNQQVAGELQTIGTNLAPGNTEQQMVETANAVGSTEQLTGISPGQQTSFDSNPTNFQQQMVNPNAPIDPLWQLGSAQGVMPYFDPLQELALIPDPYAQEMFYSNQAMPPTFINGMQLPNEQPPIGPGQVQTSTGQSAVSTSPQQSVLDQSSTQQQQQQQLNPLQQQTGVLSGTQSQFGPTNLHLDQNQPYMANDPSLSSLRAQPLNAAVPDLQQTGTVVQLPQNLQFVDTVQQPLGTGTQITTSAQNQNTAAGNTNIASSSQRPMAPMGIPSSSQTASGSLVQQNAQLSDQSLQYRQAILDSILSSLQPQVIYNPTGGLNVPVGSSASSTATHNNRATITTAAVVQRESPLPSNLSSAQILAEVGKRPTSPLPSFTVSDVIKSLATGGQVSNLPDQQTILADKKTANVQSNQLISNQFDMSAVTTSSPLSVSPLSPVQDAGQLPLQNSVFYGARPKGSILQPLSTRSAFVPRNDFWGELALASAIFNHPKQPMTPVQKQQKAQKEKQQEKQLNSLLQSLMLASLLPENNTVKMASSGLQTDPVVKRGDLSGSETSPVFTRSNLNLSLSASNKPNSSKSSTSFSKTILTNTVIGLTSSLKASQNPVTFSTKVPSSHRTTTTLGITLAPVTQSTPSLRNQPTVFSQSVVRRNQPKASFTPEAPLMNFSTGRTQQTPVMPM